MPVGFNKKLKKKNTRDPRGVFAAVLTDSSRPFDWIPHNLLVAKWKAFGKKLLAFFSAYFENRKQKTRLGKLLVIS